MVDYREHKIYMKEMKNIILEIEHHSQFFTREELLHMAKYKGIPKHEAEEAIEHLLEEHYIHYVVGTEGLLARTIWRDYSPAFEEMPEY